VRPGNKKQMGIRGKKTRKWEGFPIVFLLISFSLLILFLWSVFNLGKARRGQGELLPRAAGGLIGVAADGEREGLYIISP